MEESDMVKENKQFGKLNSTQEVLYQKEFRKAERAYKQASKKKL